MKRHVDDPRLTAYALGELDDAQRAAVEKTLAGSAAARAAVDEIRATAGLLSEALAAEPAAMLTDVQRAALAAGRRADAAFDARRAAALRRVRRLRWVWSLSAVLETAQAALGADAYGSRAEFLELVRRAQALKAPAPEIPAGR
jgi:Ca-activated chloride channel family protein